MVLQDDMWLFNRRRSLPSQAVRGQTNLMGLFSLAKEMWKLMPAKEVVLSRIMRCRESPTIQKRMETNW